jgi:hypothetical protein
MEYPQTWNTGAAKLAEVAAEFEAKLPGWWWSVGMCSVGAHASCAVDGNGAAKHLLDGIAAGHPFDAGFHEDTTLGKPHEALRSVMEQALEFLATSKPALQVAPTQKAPTD